MERTQTIILVAGLGFWVLAWLIMGLWPQTMFSDVPFQTAEELAANPDGSFYDLQKRYPESFAAYYGEATPASYTKALRLGKKIYTAEACWHCHSQQIRPVSNESLRWGPVSRPDEYQNEMHMPQMLGTRRVGPDLSRESGRHSNDWHAAHLYEPTWVVPTSVMPSYKWFYETRQDDEGEERIVPNERGIAIIAYIQWLGRWIDNQDPNFYNVESYLDQGGASK
jgi:hypothetical protein